MTTPDVKWDMAASSDNTRLARFGSGWLVRTTIMIGDTGSVAMTYVPDALSHLGESMADDTLHVQIEGTVETGGR